MVEVPRAPTPETLLHICFNPLHRVTNKFLRTEPISSPSQELILCQHSLGFINLDLTVMEQFP